MFTVNIPHQRLASQRISGNKLAQPEDVVRWMGACQAQDYHQALWAIGVRTDGLTISDVLRAIESGKILRTWPMRGTMHFVAAEDTKWMLQLSAARIIAADKRRLDQLGLDQATIEQCKDLFYEALQGGKRLPRPDMMQLLERKGIATAGGRGYHILWHSAQSGLICVGPMEGKQQTFALLDEWAPGARELSREEALAELAGRYFASRGPATLQDFGWWAGLTAADTRVALESVKPELVARVEGGKEYWLSNQAVPVADDSAQAVLLAGFDEYLLGYKDRSAVLAAEHAPKIIPGSNGVFQPTIVWDGQVVGTWKRVIKRKRLDIVLVHFDGFGETEANIREAAKRYGEFMEFGEVEVEVT